MSRRAENVDRYERAITAGLLHETVAVANYSSFAHVAVAFSMCWFFWDTAPRPYLVGLAAALTLINALTLVLAFRFRTSFEAAPPVTIRRGLLMAKSLALGVGLAWATMPYMLFKNADVGHQLIVFGTAAGLVSDAFCVGPILAVSMLLVAPVVAGSVVALYTIRPPMYGSTTLLLTIYAVFVFASQMRLARQSRQRIRHRLTVDEQGQTILLLLNDFEEGASDWLWETDRDGIISHAPARMATALGRSVEEIQGAAFDRLLRAHVRPEVDGGAAESVIAAMARTEAFHGQAVALRTRDGERWWNLNGKPFFDEGGAFRGYRGVGSDVTRDREAEARISFFAEHDALTGLPNRAAFQVASGAACANANPAALLYLDLDGFKAVNDRSGHGVGDQLLAAAADRLRGLAPPVAKIFRLGGDEFAILLGCRTRDAARNVAQHLIDAFAVPFAIDGLHLEVGLSIGIACTPDDANGAEDLLARADLALYSAKRGGKGRWHDFDVTLEETLSRRRRLDLEMREALHVGAMELHYQPLIGMPDESVLGFEALLRWHKGGEGWIAPSEIIPIAEATGFIVEIGCWALRRACLDALAWPDLRVAVNISPAHFRMPDFVGHVEQVLEETGLAPSRLEIEITESILIENRHDVVNNFVRLRAIGVRIALDDFGTGYSSLSYLTRFTFDKIKIDQSFVRELPNKPECQAVVEAITVMARALSIEVTAEGVETRQQLDMLRLRRCSSVQGFLYSAPKPIDELAPLLANRHRPAADRPRADPQPAPKADPLAA